jgi:hypothetical protein
VDRYEYANPYAQTQFHAIVGALRFTMPCLECRGHLTQFMDAHPPPEPRVYGPEDYPNAFYVFRIHNQVNERQQKHQPTFDQVVDLYVHNNADALCPPASSNERQRCEVPTVPAHALPIIVASAVAVVAVIVVCAGLHSWAHYRRLRDVVIGAV